MPPKVPPKSSGYSFMVSDEEETGEHVDLDTDLVTGGVGSGLGGLMGEGRWVEVITDDVIGDGGASSMILLLLLLLYIPFFGVLFERGIVGAGLFSFVVESQLISIMKRANPCLVDVMCFWNVSMLI